MKTGAQPNWHGRLVAGSRLLLISSAAGTENLYIVKDPHSTITNTDDDYYARIFRCKLLRGSITAQPAQGATIHIRQVQVNGQVRADVSDVSTRRISTKATPVDEDYILLVDSEDNDLIKRVGWDDLPDGGGSVGTATNITITENATTVEVASSSGTDDTIAAATNSLAGVFLPTEKVKLTGIETGATADQEADEVVADATQFSGNLSDTDTDVQAALETLDGLSLGENNVQSDLLESSSGSDAYIRNNPFSDLSASDRLTTLRVNYAANGLDLVSTPRIDGLEYTGFTHRNTISAADETSLTFQSMAPFAVTHLNISQSKSPEIDWTSFFPTHSLVQLTQSDDAYEESETTGDATVDTSDSDYDVVSYPVVDYSLGSEFVSPGVATTITTASVPHDAEELPTDASQFSGNLSDTDTDVQTALETIDGLSIPTYELPSLGTARQALLVDSGETGVEWGSVAPTFYLSLIHISEPTRPY